MQLTKSRLSLIIAEEHERMIKEKETGPVSKAIHTALDAIGLVPGYGEWADVLNAAIHAKEGNYLLASLSAISVIPLVGDAIGKGGKVTVKLRRLFPKAMKHIEKYTPEVVKGVRNLRLVIQENRAKINKFLDLLEEENEALAEHMDKIRLAIDILASPDETDESLAEKISGEMFKEDASIWDDAKLAKPTPEEIAAKKSASGKGLHVDLSKSDDDDDEEASDIGSSGIGGLGSGGGSSGGSGGDGWGLFDSSGRIRSKYLKFEGANKRAINKIIQEEIGSALSLSKRGITKPSQVLREVIQEEIQAQIMINEGLGDILAVIGGASIQKMKAWLVDLIADLFNVDRTAALFEFISNLVEDFTFEDFMDLLLGREGRCITIGQEIAHAVQETLIENLPEILGFEEHDAESKRSFLYKVIKEIIVEAFASPDLEDFIAQKLCAQIGMATPEKNPIDDIRDIASK